MFSITLCAQSELCKRFKYVFKIKWIIVFYLQVFCIGFQLYAFLFLSIYLFKTQAKPESDDSMVLWKVYSSG